MALSLALLSLARAEPVAQRAAWPAAAVVGVDQVSAGVPVGPVAVGVEARLDGGAVGAWVGDRREWSRPGRAGFRAVGAAASVSALPVARGVGAGATPWVGLGARGRAGAWAVTLAAPLAVGTGGVGAVRLPVVAALEGGVALGARWGLGARAGAGVVVTPGLDTSALGALGLVVGRR